jgi:predicted RNase H-like nuclease (RuvC/YqgF family)
MEQINEETSDFKEKMHFLTDNYISNLVTQMEKLGDLEDITNKNQQLENTIKTQQKEIDDLHMLIQQKDAEIENITEEKDNLSKVSQVKHLHVTLDQQNREIDSLKKQVELLKKKTKDTVTISPKVEKVSDTYEKEKTDEVGYVKKKIKGVEYYVSCDDDKEVYNILDNNEIGENVGRIVGRKFVKNK